MVLPLLHPNPIRVANFKETCRGFGLRKTGDYKQARVYYLKALELDPEHKGALEYLGELYVETGELGKAREHVALLRKLCPGGCEELSDLEEALAAAAPKAN
jgi:tetratricopeptide (TPR) repeat protein